MKAETRFVLVNADSVEDSDLNRKPTHEEISALAHHIYQEEGCPSGVAEDHWYAAEGFLNREAFNGA
jgi:hypothetical protein